MKDNNITVGGGIGFFGVCFLLFWDFNDKMDLYDAIIHWLLK
jgi:hypothetical protein